jgi:hypothetical protein
MLVSVAIIDNAMGDAGNDTGAWLGAGPFECAQ